LKNIFFIKDGYYPPPYYFGGFPSVPGSPPSIFQKQQSITPQVLL
jgi:hypothetical protein